MGAVDLSPFTTELEDCGLSFAVLGNSLNLNSATVAV